MGSGAARQSLRPAHIVAGCIALGLVAITGLHLSQQAGSIPRGAQTPWIGLPRSGMDASQAPTRDVIRQGFEIEGVLPDGFLGSAASLASQCGGPHQLPSFKERYIAHIGAGAWGPFWKIVLDVDGERIHILLSDGFPIPPPPPPPDDPQSGWTLIEPVTRVERSRADLERIRVLWNDESLWHAPQDADGFSCRDGNPVFLEACVDGRYAARARNCSAPAFEATDKLWRAFNELLPAPAKAEWRDATGNRVEPDFPPIPHY